MITNRYLSWSNRRDSPIAETPMIMACWACERVDNHTILSIHSAFKSCSAEGHCNQNNQASSISWWLSKEVWSLQFMREYLPGRGKTRVRKNRPAGRRGRFDSHFLFLFIVPSYVWSMRLWPSQHTYTFEAKNAMVLVWSISHVKWCVQE